MSPATQDLNVLLIVVDDIGVEWFEAYGIGQRYTTDPNFQYCITPNFDGLASRGLLFFQAYASPTCGPTRACIQTGKYAFRTGFGDNIRDPQTAPVPPESIGAALSTTDFTWIPKAIELGRPGVYDKAAIGKWHLCDGYSRVVRGFPPPAPDAFLDHALKAGYDYSAIHIPNYGCTYSWFRVVNGQIDPVDGFTTPPFTTQNWPPSVHAADALAWIQSRTKPWFLYLAFNPPHASFGVPPFETLSPATRAQLTALAYSAGDVLPVSAPFDTVQPVFRAAMESVDFCIGQVLDGLDRATRARTMVIVTGDNGTVQQALPPGFVHFKRQVFWGGTRVPFLVQGPLVAQPGRTTSALAHSVDLQRTVLDIVHAPLLSTPRSPPDGVSLLPVIQNTGSSRSSVFVDQFRPFDQRDVTQETDVSSALFDGRWRYVFLSKLGGDPTVPPPMPVPRSEALYDDLNDPLEKVDVSAAHPDLIAQFRAQMGSLVQS